MTERKRHLAGSIAVFTLIMTCCFLVGEPLPHDTWWWLAVGISSLLIGTLLGVLYHLIVYFDP